MSGTEPERTGVDNGWRVPWWQRGMYAIAVGVVVLFVGLGLYQVLNSGRIARSLIFVALLVTGLMWRLLRERGDVYEPPAGLRVTILEPDLVSFVGSIAATVHAPMPEEIYLVATSELFVVDDGRALGLSIHTTALAIGMPLVQALGTRELAALIAHELAHVGDNGVRNGGDAFRALRSGAELIANERNGFINGVFGNYARKMFRSIGGVGDAQEAAAEQAAVEGYGTASLTAALTKFDDVAVAYDQFLREYVVPALQLHVHPTDMFGGFGEMLESRVRADQRAADVANRSEKPSGEFELHATPTQRLVRLAGVAEAAGSSDLVDGPARGLLDGAARSSETLVGQWAAELMGRRTEPRSWQELAGEVVAPSTSRVARMAFERREGADNGDDTEGDELFERALALAASGDWASVQPRLDKRLKKIDDPRERLTHWATAVVAAAACAHGGFTCVHSWDGPPELRTPAGEVFDGSPIAELIVDGQADAARRAFDDAVAAS